jgi:hypothetical protein
LLAKELYEAWMAVWFVMAFFKCSLVQLLEAEGTHKVLRVELPAHSCDTSTKDGLVAAIA